MNTNIIVSSTFKYYLMLYKYTYSNMYNNIIIITLVRIINPALIIIILV